MNRWTGNAGDGDFRNPANWRAAFAPVLGEIVDQRYYDQNADPLDADPPAFTSPIQEKLPELAAKFPPPQEWYDEDFDGVF